MSKTKINYNLSNFKETPYAPFIFFPLSFCYFELILKFMDTYNPFFDLSLLPIVVFSIALGLLFAFFMTLIKSPVVSRIISGVVLFILWIVFSVEFDCNQFYKMYYGLAYSISMTGQVMGDFSSVVWTVAARYALEEAILSAPFVFFLATFKRIIPSKKIKIKPRIALLLISIIFFAGTSLYSRNSEDSAIYTHDFTVHNAVPRFGLINTFRLELTYMVFKTPEANIEDDSYTLWVAEDTTETEVDNETNIENNPTTNNDSNTNNTNTSNDNSNGSGNDSNTEPEEVKPIEYKYNQTVDFASLIENENNGTIKKMHEYFGSLEPTKQNEYTGYFEGKNLIYITAEAFCPYAIDEEFTPTLYKLSNEGFVFTDFYQPSWSLSTTGGEFANLTGVIPQWIESGNSFTVSQSRYMPYAPAGLLSKKGYVCKAYHNNSYNYYDRDKTHPNLGYDYKGIGNGLKLEHTTWPYSDLEMMEATVDDMITEYKETGVPFHTYYMTVSAHCNYNWGGNAMSRKNKEAAQEAFPDSSQTVQAYMAANLELDHALEYLLNKLEEAGIADDTVICMTADHYPYAMSEGSVDYYVELSGIEDTTRSISRYKNTLILYCSSMEEPVIVDTPCSSLDIVPTLDNLFAVEYDSRLYSGRDIFATNYTHGEASSTIPLVIIPVGNRYSFITDAGSYDAVTKEFTPNEGVEVNDDYVKDVTKIITDKWKYAKLLITNNYYAKALPVEEVKVPVNQPKQQQPADNPQPENTDNTENAEQPADNTQPENVEAPAENPQPENVETSTENAQPENVETPVETQPENTESPVETPSEEVQNETTETPAE